MALNPQNLKTPTTERAREIGRKGGLASQAAARKKKMLSELYKQFIEEKFNESGQFNDIVQKILDRGDSASVALLKELRESTEGQVFNIESPQININFVKAVQEPDNDM